MFRKKEKHGLKIQKERERGRERHRETDKEEREREKEKGKTNKRLTFHIPTHHPRKSSNMSQCF